MRICLCCNRLIGIPHTFVQTAYILETADLTAWVDQGLWEKSPKKGDSKMEARPSDTSKEDCNSTCC